MSIYLIRVAPSDETPAASYYVEADNAEGARAMLKADRGVVGATITSTDKLPPSDAAAIRYTVAWARGIADA